MPDLTGRGVAITPTQVVAGWMTQSLDRGSSAISPARASSAAMG